jgi:general secretion pathway protein J
VRHRQRGFTLIELLVSLTIISFMMLIAWRAISGAAFTRKNIGDRQERDLEIRVALNRMVRDLSSAYISANEDQNLMERRTMFIGKAGGSAVDDLHFSSMCHEVMWADANESEQTVISYSAEHDQDDSSVTDLVRKELRRPSNEPGSSTREEPADVDVLLRDVTKVHFEYWDWKDKRWQETWDSTQADAERSRLPTRVKITLEVAAPKAEDGSRAGETTKYVTEARIMLQEELKFFTN